MKKYIAPSVNVYEVVKENILAGSPDLSADPTKTSTTMESKRGNHSAFGSFDDDDEEDY